METTIVCLFILHFILFPYRGQYSAYQTDLADFTGWVSFLPCNLIQEISSNTEALSANT